MKNLTNKQKAERITNILFPALKGKKDKAMQTMLYPTEYGRKTLDGVQAVIEMVLDEKV